MFTSIKNFFTTGYKNNPDAVIIACYFNPQRNEYRKKAFDVWYDSIKHLNHFILEAVPTGSTSELPNISGKIEHIRVDQMLWHKETLLNKIIDRIVKEGKFKYIFWLDTDVIFDNKRWLVDACRELEDYNVVQPFEYCVHLDRDQLKPNLESFSKARIGYDYAPDLSAKTYKFWRSFGANVSTNLNNALSDNYDIHGHVGFAWGARTEYLQRIGGLYDKALIGGADHIMAHAFIGQIPCSCITKSFGEDADITEWSKLAYYDNINSMRFGISYVKGNLFHIWHGDIRKREYYKRIKEFTPLSKNKIEKTHGGFYTSNDSTVTNYFMNYFNLREDVDTPVRVGDIGSTLQDLTGQTSAFEGGQFGGGGAGADWGEATTNTEQSTDNYNPTFS